MLSHYVFNTTKNYICKYKELGYSSVAFYKSVREAVYIVRMYNDRNFSVK